MPIFLKYLRKEKSICVRPANCNLLLCICILLCASPLFAHEDVQDQITQISRQIAKSPKNAELYLHRGELYRARQKWAAAIADYDQAEKLDPEMNAILLCRGKLFLDSGQPQKARAALDRFLKLQPNHADAHVSRARAFLAMGNSAEAAADFTAAIQIDPLPEYYIERAQALTATGNVNDALAGLDEGITRIGNLVTLQLAAMDLELSRKNYGSALMRLDRIIKQSERKEKWFARRGDIQVQAGLIEESMQSYQQALAAIDNLPQHLRATKAVADLTAEVQKKMARVSLGR